MKDQMIQTLIQHKYQIEDKIANIEQLEEDPFLFFGERKGLSEETFVDLLAARDPEYVLEYQRWLYPKLINEIKRRYNVDDYTLSFQPHNFPSPIQFTHEMRIVANIFPFARVFSYDMPNSLPERLQERRALLIQLVELEEQLALCELIESNPIISGKGKPWGTTKALLSQKSVKKSNKEHAVKLLDEIASINRQLSECEQQINDITDKWTMLTLDLDRLSSRVAHALNLSVANPIEKVWKDEESFLDSELPQMRLDYRKELRAEYGINEEDDE